MPHDPAGLQPDDASDVNGYFAKQARCMLSIPHLVVIFLVALVVLGPEKLPQVARVLGKAMADFRRITNDFRVQIEDEMRDMERQANIRKAAATVPAANPEVMPASDDHTIHEPDGHQPDDHQAHDATQNQEITVNPVTEVHEPPELTAEIDSAIAAAHLPSLAPAHENPASKNGSEGSVQQTRDSESRATSVHENPADGESQPA